MNVKLGTVCIQCAMKHLVEKLEAGDDPGAFPTFDEGPREHQQRVHPDQAATQAERDDLERRMLKPAVQMALRLMHATLNGADFGPAH